MTYGETNGHVTDVTMWSWQTREYA